jgi:hypothetical protein
MEEKGGFDPMSRVCEDEEDQQGIDKIVGKLQTHRFGPEQTKAFFKHRSHSLDPSTHLHTLRMLRHCWQGIVRCCLSGWLLFRCFSVS